MKTHTISLVGFVLSVTIFLAWCATGRAETPQSLIDAAKEFAKQAGAVTRNQIIACQVAEHAIRCGDAETALDTLEKYESETYELRDAIFRLVCEQRDPQVLRLAMKQTYPDTAYFTQIAACCFGDEQRDFRHYRCTCFAKAI
ncbi:MAG: hypothetical protein ACRC46_14720 [Thermoguttaceae bacterium]